MAVLTGSALDALAAWRMAARFQSACSVRALNAVTDGTRSRVDSRRCGAEHEAARNDRMAVRAERCRELVADCGLSGHVLAPLVVALCAFRGAVVSSETDPGGLRHRDWLSGCCEQCGAGYDFAALRCQAPANDDMRLACQRRAAKS